MKDAFKPTYEEYCERHVEKKLTEAGEKAVYKAAIGESPEEARRKAQEQGAVFIDYDFIKSVDNTTHKMELLFYIFDDMGEYRA